MKLYYAPGTCSLAPHIVLRELGIPFALEWVDLNTHRTADGADYYRLNPKGQVPMLELDDGQRLTEGSVIVRYLADRVPERGLIPPPLQLARYRVEEWQNFIGADLHKGFGPLFNPGLDGAAKEVLRAALRKRFLWVESQLGEEGWLCGERYTVADPYLYTVARWSRLADLDLSDLGRLQRYLGRVNERPAVREALRAEELPS